MLKPTEKCFYTVLIIILVIAAILVPIVVIQISGSTPPKYIYLSPNDIEESENENEDAPPNEKYYTPSELSDYLKEFSNQRSFLFTTNEIGKTKKKHPIQELIMRNPGFTNPIILTVSGLLGSDWLAIFTTIELMGKFFVDVHRTSRLLKKYNFHFLPLMNPDGYEFSQSLPIYANWNKTFHSLKNNKPSGNDILNEFGSEGVDSNEIETFKSYFSKNKENIKAVFFLFSPEKINFTSGFFTVSHEHDNASEKAMARESRLDDLVINIDDQKNSFFKYLDSDIAPPNRIDEWILKGKPSITVVNFMANFRPTAPELLQAKSKPSTLNKPWILSKPGDDTLISIPIEVTKLLNNYHIMAVEFLYHNYRKGIKGSILNQEPDMNFPLELSAFFRALVKGPAIILVICSRQTGCFWHFHLTNYADFEVVQVTSKNSSSTYKGNTKKLALLLYLDCLKLCEDLTEHDFFSVVIEDFDQLAIKRVIKRLNGNFNVGLTYRSFYTDPDQKLQWNMLNWANPGCVGKLHEFYEIDNKNFELFNDNYRFWWLRLTWHYCESFKKPTDEELEAYNKKVEDWALENSLTFPSKHEKKPRKRKLEKSEPPDEIISDSNSSETTIINEVPSEKDVQLPIMDESPILTSIIKNFEISPEPILTRTSKPYSHSQSLPYTQTQPTCSYDRESSVILSFMQEEEKPKPSTSRSESEDFILNLI